MKDPQEFFNEMVMGLILIYISQTEGVDFIDYQLKEVVYSWYDKWKKIRGEDIESAY